MAAPTMPLKRVLIVTIVVTAHLELLWMVGGEKSEGGEFEFS